MSGGLRRRGVTNATPQRTLRRRGVDPLALVNIASKGVDRGLTTQSANTGKFAAKDVTNEAQKVSTGGVSPVSQGTTNTFTGGSKVQAPLNTQGSLKQPGDTVTPPTQQKPDPFAQKQLNQQSKVPTGGGQTSPQPGPPVTNGPAPVKQGNDPFGPKPLTRQSKIKNGDRTPSKPPVNQQPQPQPQPQPQSHPEQKHTDQSGPKKLTKQSKIQNPDRTSSKPPVNQQPQPQKHPDQKHTDHKSHDPKTGTEKPNSQDPGHKHPGQDHTKTEHKPQDPKTVPQQPHPHSKTEHKPQDPKSVTGHPTQHETHGDKQTTHEPGKDGQPPHDGKAQVPVGTDAHSPPQQQQGAGTTPGGPGAVPGTVPGTEQPKEEKKGIFSGITQEKVVGGLTDNTIRATTDQIDQYGKNSQDINKAMQQSALQNSPATSNGGATPNGPATGGPGGGPATGWQPVSRRR